MKKNSLIKIRERTHHSNVERRRIQRIKIKEERKKQGKIRTHSDKESQLSDKFHDLKVPNNFSVVNNTKEVLKFFHTLTFHLNKRHRILLEIRDTSEMTMDALLYLSSILHNHDLFGKRYWIRGNLPTDPNCRSLFLASGFLNQAKDGPLTESKDDILEMMSGDLVTSLDCKKIVDFANKHLGRSFSNSHSRALFQTILEMMNNTVEHAFRKRHKISKWWVIAVYHANRNVVEFAFLDGGLSIPKTIERKFSEKVLKITGLKDDASIIESAFSGAFRTRTQMGYRGKGMPAIKANNKKGVLTNLRVLSNYAIINLSKGKKSNGNFPFRGTLYSWDFSGRES